MVNMLQGRDYIFQILSILFGVYFKNFYYENKGKFRRTLTMKKKVNFKELLHLKKKVNFKELLL